MPTLVKILLCALLAAASAGFVMEVRRADRVRIISIEDDFAVRYPRVFLWLCILFFMFVCVLILDLVIRQSITTFSITLICILAAAGIPFLLHAVVWKIKVLPDYIIYVSALGAKRQIYYTDIKKAVVTKNAFFMQTTLKLYRLPRNIVYREYFLKRLHLNGVEIDRFDGPGKGK
ncbi:hypothetical protein LJC56_00840 [Christensenellaceae bacterium OttesenSCG-928-K19]|nr:hypothetical protein [Christensenellaceae bacterium OttesenSCG-928-K19]